MEPTPTLRIMAKTGSQQPIPGYICFLSFLSIFLPLSSFISLSFLYLISFFSSFDSSLFFFSVSNTCDSVLQLSKPLAPGSQRKADSGPWGRLAVLTAKGTVLKTKLGSNRISVIIHIMITWESCLISLGCGFLIWKTKVIMPFSWALGRLS